MSGGAAALAPAALETPATTAGRKNAKEPGGGGPHGLATAGRRPTVPTGGARLRRWWQNLTALPSPCTARHHQSPETRVSHESVS